MWVICAAVWMIFFLMIWIGRKHPGTWFQKAAYGCFYKIPFSRRNREKMRKQMRFLYPLEKADRKCEQFITEKWVLVWKMLLVGVHILVLVSYREDSFSALTDGNRLLRGEYGSGEEAVEFLARVGEEEYAISYELQGRKYTQREIEEYLDCFVREYEGLILGENSSLEEIKNPLVLAGSYENYPMEFQWQSGNYELLDETGAVYNEELSQAEKVSLTAEITYGDLEYSYSFWVRICPKEYTEEEAGKRKLLEKIKRADEDQKHNEVLILPGMIDHVPVTYHMKKTGERIWYVILFLILTAALFAAKDRDLKKKALEKRERMTEQYPEFISKFQMLFGAGMTVRGIFFRLSEDRTLGEELREEISLCVRDMKNGMSLKDAMERLGKRSGNPLYMKFGALIIQNLKKGTGELMAQLDNETREAFLLRKNHAKRLGEEVGTKLLFPMILMLFVAMAIIIVPAFLSFQL